MELFRATGSTMVTSPVPVQVIRPFGTLKDIEIDQLKNLGYDLANSALRKAAQQS